MNQILIIFSFSLIFLSFYLILKLNKEHKNNFEQKKILLKTESSLKVMEKEIIFYHDNFPEELKKIEILSKLKNEITETEKNLNELKSQKENEIINLKNSYKEKKEIYDNLVEQAAIYDETVKLATEGFYKPHFNFDTSEEYKQKISKVREKQKTMIKNKTAVVCYTKWEVHGSKAKGQLMTNQGVRLATRAFNNECDAIISNTTWKNEKSMEQRIYKSYETINKLNESNTISITNEYLNLKLEEFYLAYEYAEKKKNEREEKAELRAAVREEAKLEQEILAARKEEEKYQKLLDKAKAEAEKATGTKLDFLKEKISELNIELEEAHKKNERAMSMAQQTKAGYVYIISNIGSFGQDIYKIGMTRRLEPYDRIRELGDASVPFGFDVHALIYSDNAPGLENTLHKEFSEKRLNLRNQRREFFAVSLDEIQNIVHKTFPKAEFIIEPEAQDYFESIKIREEFQNMKTEINLSSFPEEI